MIGLYIHVPFCKKKCPYCDFYSVKDNEELLSRYTKEVYSRLEKTNQLFDTVYFGGGTPNLLGAKRLCEILSLVNRAKGCEVTLEANPTQVDKEFFAALIKGGFNRLSMGLQSSNNKELKALGRSHGSDQGEKAVKAAQEAGFENISLDLMLGTPGLTRESLGESIDFCHGLGVQHISAYMLKVENGTPFAEMSLNLPDEDHVADQYLYLVKELEKKGYKQYEISNFSKEGFESRHNLKYWQGKEYMAIGPSAHSYINGVRSGFPRDLEYFLLGGKEEALDTGGGFEEFVMLGLRLNKGINLKKCKELFGQENLSRLLSAAQKIPKNLINITEEVVSLTPQGFLLSNNIIIKLTQ